MNKQEFLDNLEKALRGLPEEDKAERIAFYNEIIEDKIDDGMSEEDVIAEIGSVDAIASQILADIPLSRLAKAKIKGKKRKLGALEITLLALGSPIWVSLLVSAFAVILSLYITLWALVVSLWAIMAALVGAGIGAAVGGAVISFTGSPTVGMALVGVGLFAAGLGIFLFVGCRAATKGSANLTKKIVLGIKRSLVNKEVSK